MFNIYYDITTTSIFYEVFQWIVIVDVKKKNKKIKNV